MRRPSATVPRAVHWREQTEEEAVELTTAQVATKLGVSTRRVRALITAGRLKARKIGRDYLIDSRDLAKFTPLPPGRPAGKG